MMAQPLQLNLTMVTEFHSCVEMGNALADDAYMPDAPMIVPAPVLGIVYMKCE